MPITAHRTKASELPATFLESAADDPLALALALADVPVEPPAPVVVPVGAPALRPPVAPLVPVAVPPVVLSDAVEKVVFLLIGMPVPPEEATAVAFGARVVVKTVGLTIVELPDGPAIMMAVATDVELLVEDMEEVEDVDEAPPVKVNMPE